MGVVARFGSDVDTTSGTRFVATALLIFVVSSSPRPRVCVGGKTNASINSPQVTDVITKASKEESQRLDRCLLFFSFFSFWRSDFPPRHVTAMLDAVGGEVIADFT